MQLIMHYNNYMLDYIILPQKEINNIILILTIFFIMNADIKFYNEYVTRDIC